MIELNSHVSGEENWFTRTKQFEDFDDKQQQKGPERVHRHRGVEPQLHEVQIPFLTDAALEPEARNPGHGDQFRTPT